MKRWLKYKYLLLFRAKGGAAMVAKGFSIGLAIEMFTLPTMGLAFFLMFPVVYFLRASFAGALIGFVIGKVIYIPLAFMNNKVGGWIVSSRFENVVHFMPDWLEKILYINMKLIVGGMINGLLLGIIAYYPVKILLVLYTKKRQEKRRKRKTKLIVKTNES